MGEFQRSPSKVWWAGEEASRSSWREISASPGSQDSGFSDTETSPNIIDLTKPKGATHKQNLAANFVEKCTPQKSISIGQIEARTPTRKLNPDIHHSEPIARYVKNRYSYTKVSRNLFRREAPHQYAKSNASVVDAHASSVGDASDDTSVLPESVKTLPLAVLPAKENHNLSAPAAFGLREDEDEAVTAFNQDSSDSELEQLFQEPPMHTSTPKASDSRGEQLKLGKLHAINLLQKYKHERVPPISIETVEDGTALKKWMEEIRLLYEPECMTTLQCKSIAGDLSEKVSSLAGLVTTNLRQLLSHNIYIERNFELLRSKRKQQRALRDLLETLKMHYDTELPLSRYIDDLKTNKDIPKVIQKLYDEWSDLYRDLLRSEVKNIVLGLEDPTSELDVRAKLTALTSITLRSEILIDNFISCGAVQTVSTLCEKCEGSSVRALALRALSTLCINAVAIRKFENSDGLQLIAETIADESRPEPERTEAIALFAQITAPWIEDNHNVQGLQKYSKRIVKYLTRYLKSCKCCQNILLCSAALANLTAMDVKSIRYLMQNNSVSIILDILKTHGSNVSIYLLEQIATLIANMSSVPEARVMLTNDCAAVALMCFLQSRSNDEDVIKRLQQKCMIGLSRLCGEHDSAQQVVEMGGIPKLVRLCKERSERFDSDAILVAALATLRRIAEACGVDVVGEEDAQELIQPRLLDSFMAYSAQNESLV